MLKLDLEKAEEPEIKFPTSVGHWKSKRVPEKHLLLLHNKLWKIQEMESQTTSPASWEICMQVKKQQLELDIEQQTGFK